MNDTQQQLQAHRDAWNILPWLVNGTADEGDRQRVTAHLAECTDCREELAFQQSLQVAMTSAAPIPHDAESALQRLIDRIEVNGTAPTPKRAGGRFGIHALVAAVAVQAVAIAALGGLLWGRQGNAYVTLSNPPAPRGAQIRLVPSPTLRLSELRLLLNRHRLRVDDSNGDLAVLGLSAAQPASAPVDVADAVRRLRLEPGVLLAEPVQVDVSR